MLRVVNYFVLISSVFVYRVRSNQNEPAESTAPPMMMSAPVNMTQELLENNVHTISWQAVVNTIPEINLNESSSNVLHNITLAETLKNVVHNHTLDETPADIVNNITLDESLENIFLNNTLEESLRQIGHNNTLEESFENNVDNITLGESPKIFVHNITLGESSDNIVHNFTLFDKSLGNIARNTTLAESSRSIVHNITLDGPVLPVVFSSLPFLFLRPSTPSFTKVSKSANANTRVHPVTMATNQTKLESGSRMRAKSIGHVTFPQGGFNLLHYKQYPWERSKQANSSRMPNLNSTISNTKYLKEASSSRMPNLISAIPNTKYPKEASSSRIPALSSEISNIKQPKEATRRMPNLNSAIPKTKKSKQANARRMSKLIGAIFNNKYPKQMYSNRMPNLSSATANTKHSISMSEILDFLDHSSTNNVDSHLSTRNIRKNNGPREFNNRPVWRFWNSSFPMLVTLGAVQHKAQARMLTGSDVKAEDDDTESFMRSRPLHTKPLIYFRRYSENDTSGGAQDVAVAPSPISRGVVSGGESHVCVTRCPRSLVAIEVVIENVTRVCTGILLVDNFVLTGGSCIPADWRAWFASHPGEIKLTPLFDTGTTRIRATKVRYYNSQGRAWPEHTDVVVLKVETGPLLGGLMRSTFDPARMWVQESECYLYVFKEKSDSSVPSFSERKISQQDYAYYYDEDYEQAKSRKFDLVKMRVSNVVSKPNRTVLNMNSSQLMFSVYRKPIYYTTGVVYCADSFDSLLVGSAQAPPASVLVLLNLSDMFYDLNRFIFAFHPSMMNLHKQADYLNVDESSGRDRAAPPSAGPALVLLGCALLFLFT